MTRVTLTFDHWTRKLCATHRLLVVCICATLNPWNRLGSSQNYTKHCLRYNNCRIPGVVVVSPQVSDLLDYNFRIMTLVQVHKQSLIIVSQLMYHRGRDVLLFFSIFPVFPFNQVCLLFSCVFRKLNMSQWYEEFISHFPPPYTLSPSYWDFSRLSREPGCSVQTIWSMVNKMCHMALKYVCFYLYLYCMHRST